MTTILIIEDGNEYLENLEQFVSGPRYLQAHDGATAVACLADASVDLIYLDMRFDRIERGELVGDHAQVTQECNGDPGRAWRFLQNNQGLFILDYLAENGHAGIPVILAYDFSREPKRVAHLRSRHPRMEWVGDMVTPDEIMALMERLIVND